jgi:lysophospholipase L1-like esterase
MITNPLATRVLCYGDSNTNGMPADDVNYVRLAADFRWTGRLQALLGEAYDIIEEGLSGRTTDVDYADRVGANGRAYFLPCLQTHHPLDAVVIMLGTNDLKIEFDRTPAAIADALHGYVDDIAMNVATREGLAPATILVSPITLDDERPLYAELTQESFDRAAVEKSRQLAAEIRRVAHARNMVYLDAASVAHAGADGIHLSRDSHAPLAELLAATLKDHCGR